MYKDRNRLFSRSGKADPITLVVFVVIFLLVTVYYGLWSTIDCWLHDFWQNSRIILNRANSQTIKNLFPVKGVNKDIVLIVIDDPSLIGINKLLSDDRTIYAKALENLKDLNPKAVGLDVFFGLSDEKTRAQDRLLVAAVKNIKDKLVLRAYRRDDSRMTIPFPELSILANYAPSYFRNYRDKTIRSVSLQFTNKSENSYKSFQTLLWAKYKDLDPEKDIVIKNNALYCKDQKLVNLINSEYLLINYDRPLGRFLKFSFSQLYDNVIPKEAIENKLVIIGKSNSMVDEKFYTPTTGDVYSPVLNGLVLSNILENSYITPNNPNVTIAITLIALILLFFVFSAVSPSLSLLITFLINLIFFIISFSALLFYNTQFDIIAILVATDLAFMYMIGKRYYAEYSEKKHIKSAFQHYVTASVVNEILKDPTKLNLHGEERNLTIFFSDIEGFTTLAEGMSPLDVVSLLNEYLTAMTDIIFEFDGLLDKYEGDAIMAVFGAPVDMTDHATRACRCALKNQKVLNTLREKWHNEGKPEMRVRIGINTGVVVVGNMGSTMRFDYTVIGDNVNLAARLEGANKIFNSSILVSEDTAKLAEAKVISRKVATMKAIGKVNYTNVYELLADKVSDSATEIEAAYKAKEAYESANNLLEERKFAEAEKILGVYLKNNPNDEPAKILYNKIRGFLLIPPPPDWVNIVKQEEK